MTIYPIFLLRIIQIIASMLRVGGAAVQIVFVRLSAQATALEDPRPGEVNTLVTAWVGGGNMISSRRFLSLMFASVLSLFGLNVVLALVR